jgi:hypothetical protein
MLFLAATIDCLLDQKDFISMRIENEKLLKCHDKILFLKQSLKLKLGKILTTK